MNWVDHTIWWHVYPLGFVGAPIRGAGGDGEPGRPHGDGETTGEDHVDIRQLPPNTRVGAHLPGDHGRGAEGAGRGRLLQLVDWLDYAVDLGVSGLLLGPIFASSTHGYDSVDQFKIDPRLGDEASFDELVAQCHRRGLRLILDGVFSHVGAQHPLLRQALSDGPDNPEGALFDIDWGAPGGPRPSVFEGHGSLVRLDHMRPAARDYTRRVMRHWLERGIDGWRLDAAYSVPTSFWRDVLTDVRKEHPQAWFLGEVIHGDYSEFVRESTVNSVTQYQLWKALWSSLLDVNFFELAWALDQHNKFLDTFVPNTFVGNHDVTRIASKVGTDYAVLALTVLMTVGGIPSIYYGDEQGFTGVKEDRLGGDDAVRPAMPTRPEELLPYGRDTYLAHQQLIGVRRRHPWLVSARVEVTDLTNQRIAYRSMSTVSQDHIEVSVEVTDTGAAATITDARGQILWMRRA